MADDTLDDFDLDDDDDMPSGESGVPAPTDYDDDDFDLEDDFDYDEGGGSSKFKELLKDKKKLAIIGVAAVLGLSAIGGGAWYFMSDGDDAEMAEAGAAKSGGVGTAVGLALQQQATSGLTPQTKLTAGGVTGGAKLTAGGATTGKLTAGAALSEAPSSPAPSMGGNMGGYNPENPDAPLSTAAVGEVGVMIPAVLPTAVAGLGTPKAAQGAAQAVDGKLLEQTQEGLLPIISEDGRESWKTYARPFGGDPSKPMIGLVITGLGMSESLTQAVIDHAPAEATLAFSPYGRGVKQWVEKARAMGHEVLLDLPMEAESFPVDDPGPLAMMTTKKPAENLKLLSLIMGQAQGYTGFVGEYGTRFLRDAKAMAPVLGELKARGLFFMDPHTAQGSVSLEMADQMQLPRAIANSQVDTNVAPTRIRAQLETLAAVAKNQGMTVAMMRATPNSLEILKTWAGSLQAQGVQLTPMSFLAGRQKS
ncbi:hypothetical protein GCM10011332_16550 [Terasakiella brassicae]|uniref:Divergent polysaccharide deacetylase family protein n=1 Tax=Terasakiella brassicae TaxID=1634917 RepID=A0A917BY70_9PROT|nr:divergent polysaccharide deacetylase family protein [Terasakiella brassicae]GGF63293.1 hypothetical protein GCM10011332_16550 [Terasakiella brassicae]